MMKDDIDMEQIRQDSSDEAFKTYATACIFRDRADKYRKYLRLNTFLGIFVPISFGALVSFNAQSSFIQVVEYICAILAIFQLCLSAFFLAYGWEDSYTHSLSSMTTNYDLSRKFQGLAQNPPNDLLSLKEVFNELQQRNSYQEAEDYKQGVTPKEMRKGMRYALYKFQESCSICGKVPKTMEPTLCDTCGNF